MIPVSSLVLGTVKFGLGFYGYNSESRPTAQDSLAVIRHAWRHGIYAYDTALGYGDAIYLLREAGIPAQHIICKCRPPLTPNILDDAWEMHWLVHNPTVAQLDTVMVGCGVSVYTVAEVEAAQAANLRPIQAPASCLNPPVSVDYARAPFLQGVLLRDPAAAPAGMQRAVRAFQTLADDAGVSRVALALHSAHRRADGYLVFGVSSVAQLDAVLDSAAQDVPADLIAAARALAATVDATAALPSLWSKP